MNTAERPTCPLVPVPGNRHFRGLCEDCDVAAMAYMTLGAVEDAYYQGRLGQDAYEAFCHVWAILSPARSGGGWRRTPEDDTVRRIARKLLRSRNYAVPSALTEEN